MGPLRRAPPLPPTSQPVLSSSSPHDFFSTPFLTLFSYSIFSHNCPKTLPKRGSKKRQKSQKSVKDHSSNLAWKSCLQKGFPKCENRIPFNVLSLFPRFPGTPKKLPNWTPN